MTLFKKKKETPALIYVLNQKLKEAREKEETSFYYPLWEHEVKLARSWGIQNRLLIEPDHQTNGNIIYKFYGYKV